MAFFSSTTSNLTEKRKKKWLTDKEKTDILLWKEKNGTSARETAAHFGINYITVYRILKERRNVNAGTYHPIKLKHQKNTITRKNVDFFVAEGKQLDQFLAIRTLIDRALCNWLNDESKQNSNVTDSDLYDKARDISIALGGTFPVTVEYIEEFKKRRLLEQQQNTSIGATNVHSSRRKQNFKFRSAKLAASKVDQETVIAQLVSNAIAAHRESDDDCENRLQIDEQEETETQIMPNQAEQHVSVGSNQQTQASFNDAHHVEHLSHFSHPLTTTAIHNSPKINLDEGDRFAFKHIFEGNRILHLIQVAAEMNAIFAFNEAGCSEFSFTAKNGSNKTVVFEDCGSELRASVRIGTVSVVHSELWQMPPDWPQFLFAIRYACKCQLTVLH